MDHKNVKIPTWDELFIKSCYLIGSKSKDISTQIGSVIVRDRSIISEGYNDFPRGVNDEIESRRVRPLKLLDTAHSEFNAVVSCARNGISLLNSTLYTLGMSCSACMQSAIQGGVREIVLHQDWMDKAGEFYKERWSDSREASEQMAKESGIQIRYFTGKVNHSLLLNGELVDF